MTAISRGSAEARLRVPSVTSWTRLEPHMGPLLLVYPMLIVAYACGLWLLLYRA